MIFYFKIRRDPTRVRLAFRIFRSIYWIRGSLDAPSSSANPLTISVRLEVAKSSTERVQTIRAIRDSHKGLSTDL